ncbi:protein MIZU-KUSSEI 1 [Rhododendron vialii]|uniref:protein MIZU-KUSSEI 1 n=1 Tax=Rhododendron vialii TaxID=182163 RepID=UPI00265F66F7|nr:protein MIZU-KUSSEI 1 [Rhododendron vialii]
MTKTLRRFLLPCFTTTTSSSSTTTTPVKKRLSTSLRDDIEDPPRKTQENIDQTQSEDDENDGAYSPSAAAIAAAAPPRASKTMVIGTIFGHRRGHVWFCVQHDRLSTRPALLLELPIPTHLLVKEMRCGLVRIALETLTRPGSELVSCPLRSVPVWTMLCNGRKLGFAGRRKATESTRLMLKTMQSITVGAGVLPAGFGFGSGSEADGELMYMRANYECVVGGPDSESFHLINPDECPGQELSIFLMRSR